MHLTLANQHRMLWCKLLQKFILVYLVLGKFPFFFFPCHFMYSLFAVDEHLEGYKRQFGQRCRSIKSKMVNHLPGCWKPSSNVDLP